MSSPGVHFGDPATARAPAREVDEDGAAVVRARPGRFGLWVGLTDGEAEECPTVTAEFAARFCA
ncbi:hypothetical protein [Streptomyces collinus]|uniref:hypothetical protein n=1 Tax=Streptomyces collinus TaxID=42684 RepID=UPI00367CAB0F